MLTHIWLSFSATNIVFQNVWFVAAIWMALALIASLVSIRTGISVALIEIFIGVVAGNFLHLTTSNEWINFLALLGSGASPSPCLHRSISSKPVSSFRCPRFGLRPPLSVDFCS